MTDFPLFNTLLTDLSDKALNSSEKKKLIEGINKLDNDGHEAIYALTKKYYLEFENGDIFDIPYEGKLGKASRIDFDLENFPAKLCRLLQKFVILHLRRMEELQEFSSMTEDKK